MKAVEKREVHCDLTAEYDKWILKKNSAAAHAIF